MNQAERRRFLIEALLAEEPERFGDVAVPAGAEEQRALLRALVNVRPPRPVAPELLAVQDDYLQEALREQGVVCLKDIAIDSPGADPRMLLWRGDITRLAVDAVVNAANSALLGCFTPCHRCIDNAIHTFAGMQLRQACAALEGVRDGAAEPSGTARITPAFNLPAHHVLHTVGPIVAGRTPTPRDAAALASCYRSCLDLAAAHGLPSVAFCCISTGEFGYPPEAAARTATSTVRRWLDAHPAAGMTVVFDVFTDRDEAIYRELLGR